MSASPVYLAIEHLREATLTLVTHQRREEHEHSCPLLAVALAQAERAVAVLRELVQERQP